MGKITASVIDLTDDNKNITSGKEEVNNSTVVSENANDNTTLNKQLTLSLSTDPFASEFSHVPTIPQQDAENIIDEIDKLLLKSTTSSSAAALLTPIAPNHPMSRLVFYLSFKEHFTDRIEKILNQKHIPIVKLITNLKGPNGLCKNVLVDYLELKNLSSNDDSPICELSCQQIFERTHRIMSSHGREAVAWLFQGKSDSIFYRLLKQKWHELQNDLSLKNHWHDMLSLIINADCTIPIKSSLLSMIVKLPLNQSWLELLFDYQQNRVDSTNRHWLLNFLEEFTATRKKACMSCLELILRQGQESYIVNLTEVEVIQINELLAAYHCNGFVLTKVLDNFYRISQINKQNCAVLKDALNFSFTLRSSLFTHQAILKEIFLKIRGKVFGFPIQMTKKDEKFLNKIYANYFFISYENNIAVISFTNVFAYEFILKKLSLTLNNNSNQIPSSANKVETKSTTSSAQKVEQTNEEIPLSKTKLPKKKTSRKKTEFSQEVQPLKKVKPPKKSVKPSEGSESERSLKKHKEVPATLPPIYLETPPNQEPSTENSEIDITQQNELSLSSSLDFLKELHKAADLSQLSYVTTVPTPPQEISQEVIEAPTAVKTWYSNNPAIKDSLAALVEQFGVLSGINKTSKINLLQPEPDPETIDLS